MAQLLPGARGSFLQVSGATGCSRPGSAGCPGGGQSWRGPMGSVSFLGRPGRWLRQVGSPWLVPPRPSAVGSAGLRFAFAVALPGKRPPPRRAERVPCWPSGAGWPTLPRPPEQRVGGRAPCSRAPLSERPGGQSIGVCPAAEGEAAAACPAVSKGAAVAGPRPPGAQACVAASAGAGAARPRRGGRGLGPRHVRAGRQAEGGRLRGGAPGGPPAGSGVGRAGREAGRPVVSKAAHRRGLRSPAPEAAGRRAGGGRSEWRAAEPGGGWRGGEQGRRRRPPARPPAFPASAVREGSPALEAVGGGSGN